jgi:CRP-like cAMP-binding protein
MIDANIYIDATRINTPIYVNSSFLRKYHAHISGVWTQLIPQIVERRDRPADAAPGGLDAAVAQQLLEVADAGAGVEPGAAASPAGRGALRSPAPLRILPEQQRTSLTTCAGAPCRPGRHQMHMQRELIQHLAKYVDVTSDLEEALEACAFIRHFPKNTLLLQEGQVSDECFFILQGCIRSYFYEDGEEITTEIYTESQSVTPPCYGKNIPSKLNYACVEDTIATLGTTGLEADMYSRYPQLETMSRKLYGILIANHQEELLGYKHSSPEQRYLRLLETRPYLFQRVPLHQIASYLGMKPESLSRIRKRVHLKSKKS